MRTLKNIWHRIPRPVRALLNILAILVLVVTFYVCIGAPAFNDEHAFRREEQANLLGPSTILFNEKVENYSYGKLILAETDDCVITWVDDSWYGFNYHEKTGDITVVTGPEYWFEYGTETWEVNFPVFVVDDHPEAIQAEIELDIQGVYIHNLNGERLEEPLDHHFALSSHRENDGFFYFRLILPSVDAYDERGYATEATHGVDGYAVDALAQTFTNAETVMNPQSNVAITATVRLYDESDALILDRDMVLRTMSEETTS